jgi:hypothetical protein
MPDEFLRLDPQNQREVINAASQQLDMVPAVVEKDVWVCYALNVLYSIPNRRPMVFKGGTSLSKVFNLIKRFSEDIDISINFLQDYKGVMSKTRAGNLRDEIEAKLQAYKADVLLPVLEEQTKQYELIVESGETDWELHINYKSVLASVPTYIKTRVKIELSGRNETEPSKKYTVRPYLLQKTDDLVFPEATIDALLAERTFWEKVTLIHAGLNSGSIEKTPERLSRHWSDVSVIMKTETGKRAIEDKELRLKVIKHKDAFWRDGKAKYDDCLNKKFNLVPTGNTLALLKRDYEIMLDSGMFFNERPASFDEVIEDIRKLESHLNS